MSLPRQAFTTCSMRLHLVTFNDPLISVVLSLQKLCKLGNIMVLVLEMKKLRFGEVQWLARVTWPTVAGVRMSCAASLTSAPSFSLISRCFL